MKHLIKSVHLAAGLDDQIRINKILSKKWIGYTRAATILNRMEELLNHPQTHRMPTMLIVGPPNNGKTLLLNKFFGSHKPIILSTDTHLKVPVLYVQMPLKPDERRFYNVIFETLNAPQKTMTGLKRNIDRFCRF
jgi:TniB protein